MWRRLGFGALVLMVLATAAGWVLLSWPLRTLHPVSQATVGVIVIRDAKVYPTPDAAPVEHATVVLRDGLIESVGTETAAPPDAVIVPCMHCVVTAGFWNTHVHFTEAKWLFANWRPAATLDAQLADMLTSRGFTTVVDTGSDPRVTVALRRRIETGELRGPTVYTAGAGQYPPNGIPFYVRDNVPRIIQYFFLLQPSTPAEAARAEEHNIARGADLLKLFTGSYVDHDTVLPMPEPNARAAVAVAHAHGQLAFSHPSNRAGVEVAAHSGVDVLAHAPDTPDGIDAAFLQTLIDKHMAMIPTLKMFATTVTTKAAYLEPIYAEVRQFRDLGGQLLFGTDVGYMTDYATQDEFRALEKSGLTAREILAMLTTSPSQRFGVQKTQGRLVAGASGDVVVLGSDPAADVAAFADVQTTIRHGRVIFSRH